MPMSALPTPSRRSLLLGGGAVLAFTLAACGGSADEPGENDGGTATGDDGASTGDGGSASDRGGASDGGGAAAGRDIDRSVPYLELAGASSGKMVDLLLDFRCPPCRGFMETFGTLLRDLVESEELVLRIHPRPMLDLGRDSTYSQDTAGAAAAVYAQDPALLLDFEEAMYAAQPESPDEPEADIEEIARIAQGVGGDETCLQQIRDRVYVPWTLEVVEPAAQELEVGTPTLIIDGEIWEGDWTQPGAVENALRS